jgi:phosphate transport system permease protein
MSKLASDLSGKAGRADRVFGGAAAATGALVLVILALIFVNLVNRARPAFELMGTEFFTSSRWAPADGKYGALGFICGTVLSSFIALLLAVPISIGIALFTTQVAPDWLRRPIVSVIDLLAVVPSVVFGLWGLLVLAGKVVPVYDFIHRTLGSLPLLGRVFGEPSQSGRAIATAGIILAIMIIPIITSLSREVMDTTPPGEKEGAYALGATRWEMIRGSVLPHSKGGLVGAVMLGLGRALGETIAAALVIGSVVNVTLNVFATGDSMAAVIANQWGEADAIQKSALIALAVVLFLITIIVNVFATAIVERSQKKSRGA